MLCELSVINIRSKKDCPLLCVMMDARPGSVAWDFILALQQYNKDQTFETTFWMKQNRTNLKKSG